jgi:integrase
LAEILYLNRNIEKGKKGEGSVTRKKGSSKLYVDFYYFGERLVKSTGLVDTPENEAKARAWLDRQLEKIDDGTFKFAEAFPGASDEEKRLFAEKEGWDYKADPQRLLFEDYVRKWRDEIWSNFDSEIKKQDFDQVINDWLIPYFGKKTFYQITSVEVQKFIRTLKWRSGKNEGKPLSRSRVKNIHIPFRAIWNDACDENHWSLPDPFRFLSKHMPKASKKRPIVFRFDEWMKVVENIDPFYRPVAETMIMTGMIGSEIAGLRPQDILADSIHIQNSVVRKMEKNELKTEYRKRELPLTKALRERLESAKRISQVHHVFTMKSGEMFNINAFRKTPWTSALNRAEVAYRTTYITRHTFAAWALTIGMTPDRLAHLMGHGSKQMVYEVYGKYVKGLEKDAGQILEYFGSDFLEL